MFYFLWHVLETWPKNRKSSIGQITVCNGKGVAWQTHRQFPPNSSGPIQHAAFNNPLRKNVRGTFGLWNSPYQKPSHTWTTNTKHMLPVSRKIYIQTQIKHFISSINKPALLKSLWMALCDKQFKKNKDLQESHFPVVEKSFVSQTVVWSLLGSKLGLEIIENTLFTVRKHTQ